MNGPLKAFTRPFKGLSKYFQSLYNKGPVKRIMGIMGAGGDWKGPELQSALEGPRLLKKAVSAGLQIGGPGSPKNGD